MAQTVGCVLSENTRTHRTKRTLIERRLFQVLVGFLGGNGPHSWAGKEVRFSALPTELRPQINLAVISGTR